MNTSKIKKIFLLILIILSASFLSYALILGVPPTFEDPVLEFPIKEEEYIDDLRAHGIKDWGDPGEHHNGIDLCINKTVTIISPVKGTVTKITENKNPHSKNNNILFEITIKINWGWEVGLCLEPHYDGDDDEKNEKQREAITVTLFQRVDVGDKIAKLLYKDDTSHLHYELHKIFKGDVCAYKYSSDDAKDIFDDISEETDEPICV